MAFMTDRKRAEGNGSAKSGTMHHWHMMVSSVALVVLLPIFIFQFGATLGGSYEEVIAYYSRPVPAAIAALTMLSRSTISVGCADIDRGLRAWSGPQGADYCDDLPVLWCGCVWRDRHSAPCPLIPPETDRMAAYEYETHTYDAIVIGAGGAGLRATLGLAEQG